MAVIKNIYLYYHKEIPEPDTWDFEFSYFFGILYNQITGFEIQIYSNLDVSQTQVLKTNYIDIDRIDAFVIIQNTIDHFSGGFENLKEFGVNLEGFPIERIFQVIKKGNLSYHEVVTVSYFQQYRFFELNHRTMQILNYDPDIPGDSEIGFWEKLSDLAYDIKFIEIGVNQKNARDNTIYLAEVSDDQVKNRDKIKRELLLMGYRVLPTSHLTRKLADFEVSVIGHLSESILSLNILGETYGDSPQMSDYSYVELQNHLFDKESLSQKKLAVEPKIHRIIWTQPILNIYDDKQNHYFKRIQKEANSIPDTDFVQSTIADLVEIVEKTIKKITSGEFEFIEEDHKSNLCILFDRLDQDIQVMIQKKLGDKKIPYKLFDIQNNHFESLNGWIHEFKNNHNFVIINSLKGNSWIGSLLALIIRSKGLADAQQISSLTVFTDDTEKHYSNLYPVEIQLIPYRQFKFEEQLDLVLSKLKV